MSENDDFKGMAVKEDTFERFRQYVRWLSFTEETNHTHTSAMMQLLDDAEGFEDD